MYKTVVKATAHVHIAAQSATDTVQATARVITQPVTVAAAKFRLDVSYEKAEIRFKRGVITNEERNATRIAAGVRTMADLRRSAPNGPFKFTDFSEQPA